MLCVQNILATIPLLFSMQLNFEGIIGPMGFKGGTPLTALLIVALSSMMRGIECTEADVEKHLEMGKKFLAAGQFADALSHYHAAIEGDPTNYMIYYRRATVYLAMGRSKSALPDLDKVIELKPDFTSARIQRANVKMKQGRLKEAQKDYTEVLNKEPGNNEAQEKLGMIQPLQQDIEAAKALVDNHDHAAAIDILTRAIESCPWDVELRELRATSYIAQGDYFKAINDIRPTTKLRSDNTAGHYKISTLYYEMGDADESLTEIRECLKLDPDHKECFPHYKKVKKLAKQIKSVSEYIQEERWEDCVNKANQMLTTEPRVYSFILRAKSHICHCQSKGGNVKAALEACNEILQTDENNLEALCDRAEAYILNEQFQEAVEDYKKAHNIDQNYQRAADGVQRAEKLLKQSLKRDYYKILGVKRNASKKQITKAYRKLAVKWHPDKYEGDEEKKKAEKMFMDIAAAKEVLSDPEMRAKFDNGEDPLDAEEQAQANNPWQHGFHGFNPFGSGGQGFNFKFHFN